MSKARFWTLNLVGGICGLLIATNLVLAQLNTRLNQSVNATQNQFNQAQQIQNTAQNLVTRIAEVGQTEPALKQLLDRHDFKVSLKKPETAKTNP